MEKLSINQYSSLRDIDYNHRLVPDVIAPVGTTAANLNPQIKEGGLFAVLVPLTAIDMFRRDCQSQIGLVVGIDCEVGKVIVWRATPSDQTGEQVLAQKSADVSRYQVGRPTAPRGGGASIIPVAIDRTTSTVFLAANAPAPSPEVDTASIGGLPVGADGVLLQQEKFKLIAFDMDSTVSIRMISHFKPDVPTAEYVAAFGGPERISLLVELFTVLRQNNVHFFIISNGSATSIRNALSVVGLSEFFPDGQVVGPDVVEFQQHDYVKGEVVRARMQQMGIEPGQALFIDDQVYNLDSAKGICETYNSYVAEGLRIAEIQNLIDLYK